MDYRPKKITSAVLIALGSIVVRIAIVLPVNALNDASAVGHPDPFGFVRVEKLAAPEVARIEPLRAEGNADVGVRSVLVLKSHDDTEP